MGPWQYLENMITIGILLLIILIFVGLFFLLRDEPNQQNHMPLPTSKAALIKTVYFYVVSLIGLMMVVFSVADLVNLGLKTWVFPKADLNEYKQPPCTVQVFKDPNLKETDEQYQQRVKACEASYVNEDEARAIRNQRDAVRDFSFLVVGIPLFLYHWTTIRREKETTREA
jgi:amino acid transporter